MNEQGHFTAGSVFDELFDKEEAANLKVRAKLMNRLIAHVEERGLSQEEAALQLGVGQPRVSLLLNGKIQKFTIDALLNMCAQAGIEVDVVFGDAHASGVG